MGKNRSGIRLYIGEALKRKLSDELILEQDITNAVEYCEKSGDKVIDGETGHFFGYQQIGRFTYWVEYQPVREGFELINAYCHRMNIVLGGTAK